MIAGVVRRGHIPAVGAIVHLQAILGTAAGRGVDSGVAPLTIIPEPRVNAETDSQGIFVLYVGLPDITEALAASGRLRFRIAVAEVVGQSPEPGWWDRLWNVDNGTTTYSGRGVYEGPLHMVVSLRAIADGAGMQPDPRDPSSFAGDAARAYSELRQLSRRLPMVGFTIVPPSPEFYEFAGFCIVDFAAATRGVG